MFSPELATSFKALEISSKAPFLQFIISKTQSQPSVKNLHPNIVIIYRIQAL